FPYTTLFRSQLERTVFDLAPLHPKVATTAIVPVGLTRHRERLPALRSLTADEAQALIATVEGWQHRWLAELGSRFVFPADEIYLLAGRPLPPSRAYEGFPVVEDGIGLVRRFEDGFARALARRPPPAVRGPVTLVTGEMFGPRLRVLLAGAGLDRHGVRVAAVPNDFFGPSVASRRSTAMARGADLPVIAIVGRPNVGKSTLFNRFVGRRQALVHDVPGVTRDRLYGQVSFERWQAAVIDTGGFDPSSEEPLIEGVRRQVLTAVEEADLVLLVVDAREGATA